MWGSLNDDAQSRLRDQGGSVQDLQKQMETAKQHGIKLEEVSYIGGKALPDGTSMQFYLVGIRQADTIPDPANPATQIKNPNARSDIDYQPYMFTLDRDGKIAKVQLGSTPAGEADTGGMLNDDHYFTLTEPPPPLCAGT